jgi:[ribosomal protein S5]-alanine N-acetyltransferase
MMTTLLLFAKSEIMKIIRSKRFILRNVRIDDAESIYRYQQDSETKKNFMTVPKSVSEVKRDLRMKTTDSERLAIDINGEAVGEIGIHDIIKGHKAVISLWLAKKYRGQGIATEAVKLATDYFFKKYKLVRVQGNARSFNKASARVMEKAGYRLEGILKKNKLKNGKYLDDMVYAKVK